MKQEFQLLEYKIACCKSHRTLCARAISELQTLQQSLDMEHIENAIAQLFMVKQALEVDLNGHLADLYALKERAV